MDVRRARADLFSMINPANTASTKVMERLGMTYIGIQTHYDFACATYEIHQEDRRHIHGR